MTVFLSVVISLVVGVGLGYGFRGWIARRRAEALGILKEYIAKI